jgi:hypothetical protein
LDSVGKWSMSIRKMHEGVTWAKAKHC